MSFTVKTEIEDLEVRLYNELFENVEKAFSEIYKTSQPHEYDPDGYLEIENGLFVVGVAFVIKNLDPLIFNVVFEKPYSKEVSFSNLPDKEQGKIYSALEVVFNEYNFDINEF